MTQTGDVEVGTLIEGSKVGKRPRSTYIWCKCHGCGTEWWGYYSHTMKRGSSRLCKTCHQRGFGRSRRKTKPAEPIGDCVHHWIIETGSGGSSPGTCQKCGAEKAFQNYIEYDFRGEGIDHKNAEPGTGWLSHPGPRKGPLN